jgi:hypothetical protein
MRCDPAPPIQRPEQTVDGCLERPRVVTDVAGFSEGLVDDRIKRDSAPNELAPLGLRVGQLWSRSQQHAPESSHDVGGEICD